MDGAWRDQFRRWARCERTQAGLSWKRGEWTQSSAPEVTAAVEVAAHPEITLPARAHAVADRLLFVTAAREQLSRGATLSSLLAAIHDGPDEALLQHARLLRLETRLLAPATERDQPLIEEALALLDARFSAPVQERAGEVLIGLGRVPSLAVHVFSEAVARAVSGMRNAAAARAQSAEIDDAVFAILNGRETDDVNRIRAERLEATAARHAAVAGQLAGAHPLWWNDAWLALSREAALLPAFLSGASLTVGDARAIATLDAALAHPSEAVRDAAWGVVAVADSPSARSLLATIAREPSRSARAQVASARRLPLGAEERLHALLCDVDAGVRSAAAFNLVARDQLSGGELSLLRADASSGSLPLRYAALRALGCAGAAAPDDGASLAEAVLDEIGEPTVGRTAAEALAVWAGPESCWRQLYQRAVENRGWLITLGSALECGFPGLFPAPPELLDPLRVQALRCIGDDDTRRAAAGVLAAHPDAEGKIFELFSKSSLPESELQVLALVAPTTRRPRPALVAPLWEWIDDPSRDDGARQAAVEALGWIAPHDPALVTRLATLTVGELADEAYGAIARISARAARPG